MSRVLWLVPFVALIPGCIVYYGGRRCNHPTASAGVFVSPYSALVAAQLLVVTSLGLIALGARGMLPAERQLSKAPQSAASIPASKRNAGSPPPMRRWAT